MLITRFASLKREIKNYAPTKILLVTSPAVLGQSRWFVKKIQQMVPRFFVITVPNGEKAKTWKNLERLLAQFLAHRADRQSLVLALGGGSVGDLTGLASSLYLRGVAYIQIPTTLLAQVDSAIGGKTAIDFGNCKNQVGSFYEPLAIYIDIRFLQTLSKNQITDGLAEIIKMGFIKEPRLLLQIEKIGSRALHNGRSALRPVIKETIKAKQYFEARDPFDNDLRQMLNFGHTAGHAIEIKHGLSHGRAVLIGMARELALGTRLGITHESAVRRLESLRIALGIRLDENQYPLDVRALRHDKKIRGEFLTIPVIVAPGKVRLITISMKKFLKGIQG